MLSWLSFSTAAALVRLQNGSLPHCQTPNVELGSAVSTKHKLSGKLTATLLTVWVLDACEEAVMAAGRCFCASRLGPACMLTQQHVLPTPC
jgi:hypothetical protein